MEFETSIIDVLSNCRCHARELALGRSIFIQETLFKLCTAHSIAIANRVHACSKFICTVLDGHRESFPAKGNKIENREVRVLYGRGARD